MGSLGPYKMGSQSMDLKRQLTLTVIYIGNTKLMLISNWYMYVFLSES